MTTVPDPVTVWVAARDSCGETVLRYRLCWLQPPRAVELVRAVADHLLAARRDERCVDLRVEVEEASPAAAVVLTIAGLSPRR